MKVVIVGARTRSEAEDEPLIKGLIEHLLAKYPQVQILSTSCDRGIGKLVKSDCLPESEQGGKAKARFNFIEAHIRFYLIVPELPAADFASIFIARNAMLNEWGEEFHLLIEDEPKGMMADLLQRLRDRKAPHALYRRGEREPKPATTDGNEQRGYFLEKNENFGNR